MNLSDEIKRLADLHAQGTLSEAEFVAAKQRLLGTGAPPRIPAEPVFADVAFVPDSTAKSKQMAMFLHLSQLAGYIVVGLGFVAPIVIWQMMKTEHPSLDEHGKNVVNWMLSLLIYSFISIPLVFVIIGVPLLVVLGLLGIIFPIIGALKANEGIVWRYPLTIQFIR